MDRSSRRREMDFMKLMSGPQKVYPSDSVSEFWVEFRGPEETPYEDGVWVIHVQLPAEYPFKSPSIGFSNRIYHPNVEETSGSVCLNVINQTWTPMYELLNIFEVFLPQLLRYPNPADPLNADAASSLLRDAINYVSVVREHVSKYATREAALGSIPLNYQPKIEVTPASDNIRICSEDDLPVNPTGLADASDSLFGAEEDYKPEEIEI